MSKTSLPDPIMLHHLRVEKLKKPCPDKPTLEDIFNWRLPENVFRHLLQSATQAMEGGAEDKVIFACLLHDLGMALFRTNHGHWGAQLIEPYVDEEITWAVRYHQALRYFPDPDVGYEYPQQYLDWFGPDHEVEPFLKRDYEMARNHRWYSTARAITLFDKYAFNPKAQVSFAPFRDIVAHHFKQPPEGLGNDNTPASHMWRTLIDPFKF